MDIIGIDLLHYISCLHFACRKRPLFMTQPLAACHVTSLSLSDCLIPWKEASASRGSAYCGSAVERGHSLLWLWEWGNLSGIERSHDKLREAMGGPWKETAASHGSASHCWAAKGRTVTGRAARCRSLFPRPSRGSFSIHTNIHRSDVP